MPEEKMGKKNNLKKEGACFGDPIEVKHAMLLTALQNDNIDPNAEKPDFEGEGEIQGIHNVNVNNQTDLELSLLADPGSHDHAREMNNKVKKNENRVAEE